MGGDPLRGRSPRIREPSSSGGNSPFNFAAQRAALPTKGRTVAKTRPSGSSAGLIAGRSSESANKQGEGEEHVEGEWQ